MSDWLCDGCTSSNIKLIKSTDENYQEMDCYCYDCKSENYIVSSWWINTYFKKTKRENK